MRDDLEAFLTELTHVRRASAHTVRAYRMDLEQLLAFLEVRAPRAAARLDALDTIALRGFLADRHKKDRTTSVLRKLSAIRTFLRWAVKSGRLEVSPADRWDPLESTCRHASLSIL